MNPEEPAALHHDRWRIKTRRALGACIVLFAVSNFLIGPLMSMIRPIDPLAAIVYAMFGSIGAQGGLHAIWCVFASAGLVKRLALGTVVGLGLSGVWAMGLAVHVASQSSVNASVGQDVVIGLLCLPLMAIAIQSPLWIARCFFRWRVFHPRDPARRSAPESIGIRDILLATGAVALALSAVRVGLMMCDAPRDASLLPFVIAALLAAAVSSFTTLPLVVATLRARRVWIALSTMLILDLAVMAALMVLLAWIQAGGQLRGVWANMASMAAGFFVCLTAPLLLVRRLGYRLYWGRRHVAVRAKGPGVATPGFGGM